MKRIALLAALIAAPAWAGPLSKFEEKTPELTTVSAVPIYDLERCLMDLDGWPLPMVIRQPDRPDEVTLVYYVNMTARGRLDLRRTAAGTEVKAWEIGNQGRACIETGSARPQDLPRRD